MTTVYDYLKIKVNVSFKYRYAVSQVSYGLDIILTDIIFYFAK